MKSGAASVLVIEAHPLLRESLCTAIAAEPDLDVVRPSAVDELAYRLALTGREDVLFFTDRPDIILFSLGNPGWDDLKALAELRQAWPDSPLLALTSAEVPGQEQSAREHGAQAVLTKSASRNELLRTLRSLI